MPNGTDGYKMIYPTKKTAGQTGSGTGFVYYQSADITDDKYFADEGHVKDSSNFQWTMSTSGPDAVQVGKNSTTANAIGGCGMNFDDAAKRGYIYKADDPRDIELTFCVKFIDSGSDNGFAIEGPTAAHSSSGCCQGFAYKVDIQYRPNPTVFRFRKEMFHVSNHTSKEGEFTNSKFNFQLLGRNKWTGFKWIRYNIKDGAQSGHNTKDAVALELWGNIDPDANPETGWFMIKRSVDSGGWGDDGDNCNGDKDQIGSWSGMKFRLKSNDDSGEFDFKKLSLREIDPTISFSDPNPPSGGGGDPEPDNPTEVVGVFTLKYDVNLYRTSACDTVGGSQVFFDAGTENDDSGNKINWPLGNHDSGGGYIRHRIGWWAADNTSKLCNQPPLQEVDLYLWKQGSPTGTATVRIRSKTGSIKATIGTLDVSTLTGSATLKQFINLSNTYKMVPEDYILIEYTGGDDSNYVRVAKRDTVLSGYGNTQAVYYNVFPATDEYVYFDGRQISGKLWN